MTAVVGVYLLFSLMLGYYYVEVYKRDILMEKLLHLGCCYLHLIVAVLLISSKLM